VQCTTNLALGSPLSTFASLSTFARCRGRHSILLCCSSARGLDQTVFIKRWLPICLKMSRQLQPFSQSCWESKLQGNEIINTVDQKQYLACRRLSRGQILTLWSVEAIIVPHPMIGSWYTGRWWVGCYILYSDEGTGRGHSPPRPLLAVPNVTAHPSTASVPITQLMYNGPLLCGFNVSIKG